MSNQVINKPTAAYVLSLLGGIIGLLGALAFIAFGAMAYLALGEYIDYGYGYYYAADVGMFGWGWTMLVGFGAWMFITSILVIVFAGKLKANPVEHTKWGVLILIFSIIGVGGLLGLIGGILALVYKPQLAYPQQSYPPQGYAPPPSYQQQPYPPPPPPQQAYQPAAYAQPTYQQPPPPQQAQRFCPQCGRVVPQNVQFCQNCGAKVN